MLSVIIPAYNRANKLYEALESLTVQLMKRFFVIVVDDASQENLEEVCNKFLDKLNIIYLRQPVNSGPGLARQRGLDWARTRNIELVMFLDSDDILFPNATQLLTHEINHGKYDFIATDIAVEHTGEPQTINPAETGITWTHGKIYRLSYLTSKNICFPSNIRTNEDLAFNLKVHWLSKNRAYVNTPVYLWRDDKHSLTRTVGEFRNNAMGKDYIKAVYDAFKFIIDKEGFQINIAIPNILMCYNYYQVALERGENIPEEIDSNIREMLTHPRAVKYLKDGRHWYHIQKYIWGFAIGDKNIVYTFHESFGNWYDRLTKNNQNGETECLVL